MAKTGKRNHRSKPYNVRYESNYSNDEENIHNKTKKRSEEDIKEEYITDEYYYGVLLTNRMRSNFNPDGNTCQYLSDKYGKCFGNKLKDLSERCELCGKYLFECDIH
mgnify:CR=1 FL=1